MIWVFGFAGPGQLKRTSVAFGSPDSSEIALKDYAREIYLTY